MSDSTQPAAGPSERELLIAYLGAARRHVLGILEGDAVPQVFIPELIALWRQGRFPFDRLIGTFAFEDIDRAEQSSLSGEVIKPVLLAPA